LNDYINEGLEIIERARKKDTAYFDAANFAFKKEVYLFVISNNIAGLIKNFVNENKPKEECINAIKELFNERGIRKEPVIIPPQSTPMETIIDILYKNSNVLQLIDTFEDETNEFDALIAKTNGDLMKFKGVFKEDKVIQISRQILNNKNYTTTFTNKMNGLLNCAIDNDMLDYNP